MLAEVKLIFKALQESQFIYKLKPRPSLTAKNEEFVRLFDYLLKVFQVLFSTDVNNTSY